jgi:hypothetical protein
MKSGLLLVLCLITISCFTKNNVNNYVQSQNHEVKIVTIADSLIYDIFEWVINNDKKVNKFYSNDVAYGVRLYYDLDANLNIIRIEGTLTNIIFLQSEDLIGQLSYNDHVFYILENTFDLFEVTDKVRNVEFDMEQSIMDDDRFDIHFFGYDDEQYFRFLPN